MAKQNYAFEKRQKEIAKKQKKQEKLQHKAESAETPAEVDAVVPAEPVATMVHND